MSSIDLNGDINVKLFFPPVFFFSGVARGQDAVAWVTYAPAPCGSATQKRGSRGTPEMSLTTRSTTSSPSCLRLVSVKGHSSALEPFNLQNHHPSF